MSRRPRGGPAGGRRGAAAPLLPLSLFGAAAALALIPWPAAWVESAFARGLFPLTSRLLAPLVSSVPFSLTLALAAALVGAALATLLTPRGRARFLPRLWRSWAPWAAAVLLLGFSLVWGLSYRRDTLAALLGVPDTPPAPEQVQTARKVLLAALEGAVGSPPAVRGDVAAAARCVAGEVDRLTGVAVAVPDRVKSLPAGTLLRAGFAGVTSPWLLEPHVDPALPPAARLATATHELTHAAGFAREADTDALAVLAGLRCGDPAVRYALALHGLRLVADGMPATASTRLLAALPARARHDLRASDEAAARYRLPWLQRATAGAYSAYLESRGVRSGMADYARATTLVVQALAHGER